jgi:hypothetical protein
LAQLQQPLQLRKPPAVTVVNLMQRLLLFVNAETDGTTAVDRELPRNMATTSGKISLTMALRLLPVMQTCCMGIIVCARLRAESHSTPMALARKSGAGDGALGRRRGDRLTIFTTTSQALLLFALLLLARWL